MIVNLSCLGLWLTSAISSGKALAFISFSMSVLDASVSETLQYIWVLFFGLLIGLLFVILFARSASLGDDRR
jgi:hypothetical protein